MMSYVLPGVVGSLVGCVVYLGLAVFVFLQRSKSPALRRLLFVALGLAVWGIFPVLNIPLDIVLGLLPYDNFLNTPLRFFARILGGLGSFLGAILLYGGAVMTAVDLALPDQIPSSED